MNGRVFPYVSRKLRTFYHPKCRYVLVTSGAKMTTWSGKLTNQSGVTMNAIITLAN